jgi:hypothetical protein
MGTMWRVRCPAGSNPATIFMGLKGFDVCIMLSDWAKQLTATFVNYCKTLVTRIVGGLHVSALFGAPVAVSV